MASGPMPQSSFMAPSATALLIGTFGASRTKAEQRARSDPSTAPPIGNTTDVEGSHYDLEGREPMSAPGRIAADDHELRECDGSGGKVTDAAWDRIVAGRAVPTNWPDTGSPGTVQTDQPGTLHRAGAGARFDTAAHAQQRLSQDLATIGRSHGAPRECWG